MTTTPPEADGLLLVDKPSGVTSFAVVAEVRRRYRVRQVGHAGTLDPLASGLLVVLVGEATKVTHWTMGLPKLYLGTVRLGSATDSYDAAGKTTRTVDASAIDEAKVRAALPAFVGRVRQRPPAFSALKRDGQPLYKEARRTAAAGGDVGAIDAGEREVDIHAIDLIDFAFPDVSLRIHCGKGTYIRSLAHDLGLALGSAAHLSALRRLRIGGFDVAAATPLAALARDPPPLLPLEAAVAHLPGLAFDAAVEARVRMGQQEVLAELPIPDGLVGPLRLHAEGGRLVAIAEPAAEGSGRRLDLARVFRAAAAPRGTLEG